MATSMIPVYPLTFGDPRWRIAPAAVPIATVAPLRLLTWNIWFGRHQLKERTAALIDDLSWRAPDIVALQEVTAESLRVLIANPFIRATYQVSDVDGSTFDRYGVMLLSKVPFESLMMLPLPSRMGRRLLVGTLANGLSVATVHLESTSDRGADRVAQLEIILPLLKNLASDVVLMGDLNFSPDSLLETAAVDPSFVDAWTHSRFADPGFTIDSMRNQMRRRFDDAMMQRRIDRVLVRSTRWRVEDVALAGTAPMDAEGTFVSDHFGVETVLEPRAT
jgi:endonuclease/exonuclease/phosphatase family metal-dependent hydrolase